MNNFHVSFFVIAVFYVANFKSIENHCFIDNGSGVYTNSRVEVINSLYTRNDTLIARLDSLVKEDQKWRNLLRQFYNNELDTNIYNIKYLNNKCSEADSLNYLECEKIINKYGFPTYEIIGKSGSYNLWLLLQHQDENPDFQQKALLEMKKQVDVGKASIINYAYLTDRVLVNTGQEQIYGTQMQLNNDSTSYEPKKLFEPENVNNRRKEVSLGTIEEYIKIMNERYFGTLKAKP